VDVGKSEVEHEQGERLGSEEIECRSAVGCADDAGVRQLTSADVFERLAEERMIFQYQRIHRKSDQSGH
jgi:hypothetical protein